MENNVYSVCKCIQADEIDFIMPFIAIITNPYGRIEASPVPFESFSFELICYEGTVAVQIDDYDLLVSAKQDIFFYESGHLKSMSFSNDFKGHLMVQTMTFCNSIITMDRYSVSKYYMIPNAIDLSIDQSQQYYFFFEWLKYVLRKNPYNGEALIRTLLRTTFYLCSSYISTPELAFSGRNNLITKEFFAILEAEDINQFSVEYIANKLNIQPRSLARAVKQTTGHTLTEHLLQQRIARAKQLISLMGIQ